MCKILKGCAEIIKCRSWFQFGNYAHDFEVFVTADSYDGTCQIIHIEPIVAYYYFASIFLSK